MKNMLSQTTKLLTLSVCLHAQLQPLAGYDGPKDETPWTDSNYYSITMKYTTLGELARFSDIIGVGVITNRNDNHFMIVIDHALVGCTNGATFKVWENPREWKSEMITNTRDFTPYIPTNHSRIVFATYTNRYVVVERPLPPDPFENDEHVQNLDLQMEPFPEDLSINRPVLKLAIHA